MPSNSFFDFETTWPRYRTTVKEIRLIRSEKKSNNFEPVRAWINQDQHLQLANHLAAMTKMMLEQRTQSERIHIDDRAAANLPHELLEMSSLLVLG